jgi:hypothetical protein
MTVPEILKELEPYTGRFPKQALQSAIRARIFSSPQPVFLGDPNLLNSAR